MKKKYQNIIKNDDAISPMIGIILMLGIMLLLVLVVMTNILGLMGRSAEKLPTSVITVSNNIDTAEHDIKIRHKLGDALKAGDWWISVVPVGQAPVYQRSSTHFSVGEQITTAITTIGDGNYTVTNSAIYTTGVPKKIDVGLYDVKIVVSPLKLVVADAVVEVR